MVIWLYKSFIEFYHQVSRALGDFPFKQNGSLPAEHQMVSPEPEVLVIDRNAEDNYLIFACDGIWDAIPDPQECVTIVNELLVLVIL